METLRLPLSLFCLGCLALFLALGLAVGAAPLEDWLIYLPLVREPESPAEIRALWVTRFDWTRYRQAADPAKIDEIVDNAAAAGFNVIFFQVRGVADAYYIPGLEPWAERVSGEAIGQPPEPLWDPLATFVDKAHAQGLQLHAYLNVYPLWDNCESEPPADTTPLHFYHVLSDIHGTTEGKLNGVQWAADGTLHCSVYQRATPASSAVHDQVAAVARDLVQRYDLDGIHLDNIRYGGGDTSCDPVSEAAYRGDCFDETEAYAGWQRQQIDAFVARLQSELQNLDPELWFSAAVWPIYRDRWDWGVKSGYGFYYQDAQEWLAAGTMDFVTPMIYPGSYNCPDDSFWTQSRWQTLAADYQNNRHDRYVVPGIGAGYCTFDEVAARIEMARQLGTAGHALFSYSSLASNDYFDDLAAGPYARAAVMPAVPGSAP